MAIPLLLGSSPLWTVALLQLPILESEFYVTTDGQSASLQWTKASIWGLRPDLYYCWTVAGLLMCGALSNERTGLSLTGAAGSRQRSHLRVRVPRDSWPYFTVSGSWLHQLGGSGPRIYIPQEQGGPVIAPGTGFPFRRLLRLTGLRWRYSNPPPRGERSMFIPSVVPRKNLPILQSQSQSHVTTDGFVGQSVLA
jgi:hypothetical protein